MAASRAPDFGRSGDKPRTTPTAGTRLTADTSSQPEGITRRVMLNVLEAFFRRPVLHLIPLILMLGLGVASAFNTTESYTAVGTLSVNESLLADLTNSSQAAGFGFETPATIESRQINELLGTQSFLDRVVASAGLEQPLASGVLTRDQIRAWVGATADGQNLVRVGAKTNNQELSFRLAEATINSYRDFVVASDVDQSTSAEQSLQARVDEKQAVVDSANQAVTDKINEQPDVDLDERSLVDQEEIRQLQAQAERAREQLVSAQDALDQAKTQTDQAQAIVNQRLQVLDQPELPQPSRAGIRDAALKLIIFAVLGTILSVVSVVVSAMLDRTIRVPGDITGKFGVDVLAVVPETSR